MPHGAERAERPLGVGGAEPRAVRPRGVAESRLVADAGATAAAGLAGSNVGARVDLVRRREEAVVAGLDRQRLHGKDLVPDPRRRGVERLEAVAVRAARTRRASAVGVELCVLARDAGDACVAVDTLHEAHGARRQLDRQRRRLEREPHRHEAEAVRVAREAPDRNRVKRRDAVLADRHQTRRLDLALGIADRFAEQRSADHGVRVRAHHLAITVQEDGLQRRHGRVGHGVENLRRSVHQESRDGRRGERSVRRFIARRKRLARRKARRRLDCPEDARAAAF
mmetsp:Transcript_13283/g.46516  ORF Transcript_13283/g.46516 Transcript_13283/m.46516 type:complete len:282 (-) Transcript_13283:521-1366(-)